jgi:hypothetical protein
VDEHGRQTGTQEKKLSAREPHRPKPRERSAVQTIRARPDADGRQQEASDRGLEEAEQHLVLVPIEGRKRERRREPAE